MLIPNSKSFRALLLGIFICSYSFAQVPVTTGLRLHLDAASGFNDNGAAPATWNDLSSSGNNMVSGIATREPVYVANVMSTGFPGVQFDGTDDYMLNQTLNTTMSGTEGSLFAVRIGPNLRSGPTGTNYRAILSIADDSTFLNEMGLGSDWGLHHSSSGNWQHRTYDCFDSAPSNRPVIVSALLGTGLNDLDYQIYGSESSNSISQVGSPGAFTTVNRRITLGGRFHSNTKANYIAEPFDGYVLEVLVYNRKLTAAEEQQVNNYLINKYFGTATTGTLSGSTVCAGKQAYLTYTATSGPTSLTINYTDGINNFSKAH
jgi:hypothetical protein